MPEAEPETLYTGCRVLDLADEKGVYCTKLLADLGADVVKVEPPGGDPSRRLGPFLHDIPHPERSLFFLHMNTNKRSITLDLTAPDGQDLFLALVQEADVLVDTVQPGVLDALGLGYLTLKGLNPRLVMATITPFGQTGPRRDFRGADIVQYAMSGIMQVSGERNRPPTMMGGYQAYHIASISAAIGIATALWYREAHGIGQQVDVSIQEAMTSIALEGGSAFLQLLNTVVQRNGTQHPIAFPCSVYPCKDGFVAIATIEGHQWAAFTAWARAELGPHEALNAEWQNPYQRREHMTEINAAILEFTTRYTKAELFEEAQRRRIPICPVSTPKDLYHNTQLQARGYFAQAAHPLAGTLTYAGAPYHIPAAPWRIRHTAPLLGEHNEEIYCGELGLSREELTQLREIGVI